MIELQGKYNTAQVFTDNVEATAVGQIIELCNEEFTKGSKIRVMPDTHAGAGCVIGMTMTLNGKVVPNMVGVDIGCGVDVHTLRAKEIDFEKLDRVIRGFVPYGSEVNKSISPLMRKAFNIEKLRCHKALKNHERIYQAIGSLGGGNHFIEVAKDEEGKLYLIIHSGSRNLGKQVAEYYQNLAYEKLTSRKNQIKDTVYSLKKLGRESEIETELAKIDRPKVNKALAYLTGKEFEDYIHDMNLTQWYAELNREEIARKIYRGMEFNTSPEFFASVHNYIDMETMILRKGAVSAKKGQKLIIPINMRDGSLICVGKGNDDWNQSAPHGAGRLMSRSAAKKAVTLEEFEDSMHGIWTSSVGQGTLDESPMAYKPMQEIIDNIGNTVDIVARITPVYNFKASEE